MTLTFFAVVVDTHTAIAAGFRWELKRLPIYCKSISSGTFLLDNISQSEKLG